MNIVQIIFQTYPDLDTREFDPLFGSISIQDDSDGKGAYIAKWNYAKPIPDGLKIGK